MNARHLKLDFSATSCRYCTEASWHSFQSEFQNRQVLFFPASLYLTLLQQGVADLGLVSLLIMDEVHQATKEHPMSSILKEFHWNLPSEAAPKVLLIRPCDDCYVAHICCAGRLATARLSRAAFGMSKSTAMLNAVTAMLERNECLVQTECMLFCVMH